MIHNLKALGLAIFAVLALGAVGASLALAEEEVETVHKFKAGSVPTHLTVTQAGGTNNIHGEPLNGSQDFQFKTNDKKTLKCATFTAQGTVEAAEVEEVTVTPEYSNCSAWETNAENKTVKVAEIFVNFNGCDYRFTNKTTPTTTGTPGYHATVHIICPVGKKIETTVTAFKLPCINIGEQTFHGIKYFNSEVEGRKDVSLHITAHGIVSETKAACGTNGEIDTTGTYTGVATVKGYSDPEHKKQTNISVSPGEVTP
jgi:hypothetical protein